MTKHKGLQIVEFLVSLSFNKTRMHFAIRSLFVVSLVYQAPVVILIVTINYV